MIRALAARFLIAALDLVPDLLRAKKKGDAQEARDVVEEKARREVFSEAQKRKRGER